MTTPRRQSGLSLIELMISMTLGLIILSGVLVVFVTSSSARNEVERTARQIENGRYASELLTDDIRLAGFYGELYVRGKADALTTLPTDPCSLAIAEWKKAMRLHVQGLDDPGTAPGTCPLTNLKAGTDVLIIRRARACVAGAAGCDTATNGTPYIQVALCAEQAASNPACPDATTCAGAFTIGVQGTTTFDRQKRGTPCTAAADKRQYLVHVYFIATDNGDGRNIPTLKRLELTAAGMNPAWQTMPLVEGIEEFQLHYGLDTDGDGQADVYVANPNDHPAAACPASCQATNWTNVVAVQFHLLARNIDTSPDYTDTKTYNLGKKADGSAFEVTPGGAYRRHVYTGVVRVVNPAGSREQP